MVSSHPRKYDSRGRKGKVERNEGNINDPQVDLGGFPEVFKWLSLTIWPIDLMST